MTAEAVALDPALRMTLRAALALLFLWAGAHKLRDTAAFRAALANYRLAPPGTAGAAAIALVAAELLVASTLIVSASPVPAFAAAALLTLYAAAIAVNLWRGRRSIDCGCAGPAGRQPISGGLILRNLLVAGAAVAAALPANGRELIWIDAVTIAAGVIVLSLLYATLDTLIASSPSIQALRSPSLQAFVHQSLTAAEPQGAAEPQRGAAQ